MTRFAITALAFLAFTAFSGFVVAEHGYLGFIEDVALASDWGLQVFIDLVIGLLLFTGFMVNDARARGINPWPYLVAILGLGSIGALAYMVHREWKRRSGAQPSSATESTAPA